MSGLGYALRAFKRAGMRNAAYALGVALAVALLSGTLFFVDRSAGEMTQRALAPVLIDFQARAIDPQGDPAAFAGQLQSQPGILAALPVVSVQAGAAPTTTSSAADIAPVRLFALQTDYLSTFPVLTLTTGTFDPKGVMISEQLATRLGLRLGDPFALTIRGRNAPYPVTLSGTVNTDQSEALFAGPIAVPEGSYAVTSAVVVMDYSRFSRDLSADVQAADQATTGGVGTPLPAARVDRHVDLRIDRTRLPSDPGAAATQVASLSRTLERQVSGQVKITDHVSAAVTSAQRDVVSARLLFVFLGLPGILLAAVLAQGAAALAMEAQRRELALLRARGVSPARLVAIVAWTAVLTAGVGSVGGVILGGLGAMAFFGMTSWRQAADLIPTALIALVFGLLLGSAGAFLPARRLLTAEIGEVRRSIRATERPIWLRLPVDLALLVAAAVALWFSSTYNTKAGTAGSGETAAVSLGVYAFVGPLLFWLSAALLFLRAANWLLRRHPGRWQGGLTGLVRRSLHRRPDRSASAALLLALAVSFGVASTIFGATFEASRGADARYAVGADVRVTPPLTEAQPAGFANTLQVPGVQAVAPVFVTSDALVGSQTQTVYGVDVPSLTAATTIADSFFVGDSAQAVMDRLRNTPDGLLVSSELAASYTILSGDTVAMRIPKIGGGFTDARLQVVGIFSLFPTSAQNSDLVVNSTLLTSANANPNPAFFLLRTDGTPQMNAQVASAIGRQLNGQATRIQTADQAVSQDQSSLVGVNLAGLVLLDRLYAALVIALGFGVFLLGAIVERARELGTLQALGATLRQVIITLLLEGGVLVAGGLAGGFVIGVLLAWQYNGFLPGIFSVPLPVLSVPLSGLGALLLLALAGVAGAALLSSLRLRGLWPAEVLRDL